MLHRFGRDFLFVNNIKIMENNVDFYRKMRYNPL